MQTKTKELLLLAHLRNNARESITKMSKKTKIPISTIFDRLKEYKGNIITKHTCLLNFKTLGYDVRAQLLFKVNKEQREGFLAYLKLHPQTNNIYRINNGYDYLVEGIFQTMASYNEFIETTEEKGATERKEHFIMDDIKREAFLNQEEGMPLITGN